MTGEPDAAPTGTYAQLYKEKGTYRRGTCTPQGTLDEWYTDLFSFTTDTRGDMAYTAATGIAVAGNNAISKTVELHPRAVEPVNSVEGSDADEGWLYARLQDGATTVACCQIQLISQWSFINQRVTERTFQYWGQTDKTAAPYTDITYKI